MTSSTQISIRLPDDDTAAIDALIQNGEYANRTAAVTAAVRRLLHDARDREISEAYRRAYAEHPFDENGDEAWVIEAGRASLARMEPYE